MALVKTDIKARRILGLERELSGTQNYTTIVYRDRNGKNCTHVVAGFVLHADIGEYTDNLEYEVQER